MNNIDYDYGSYYTRHASLFWEYIIHWFPLTLQWFIFPMTSMETKSSCRLHYLYCTLSLVMVSLSVHWTWPIYWWLAIFAFQKDTGTFSGKAFSSNNSFWKMNYGNILRFRPSLVLYDGYLTCDKIFYYIKINLSPNIIWSSHLFYKVNL